MSERDSDRVDAPVGPRASVSGRRPLSSHVFRGIVTVSSLSVVVLAGVLGWRQLHDTQRELRDRRAGRASIVAREIDAYFVAHERSVTALAALAPSDPVALQVSIDTLRRTHPDVLTALATGADGTIIAASPRATAGTPTVIGLSVADRGYFRDAMAGGNAVVSGAFRGRGFGADPIVAIAAPIGGPDEPPRGIVEASIDLRKLESFTILIRGLEEASVVITDPDGVIVFSSLEDFSPLSKLSSESRLKRAAENPDKTYAIGLDPRSWSVAASRSEQGWVAYVLQDAAVAQRKIAGQLQVTVLVAALLAIVSLLAANRLAQRVTKSLEQLAGTVRSMRGGEAPANVPLPQPTAPVEIAELFDDVRAMAERVHASRLDLEQTNRQLEEMLDLARAGSRTKTAFLAKMSHELRTPLNAVIGFNSILEQRLAGDAKGAELARRAHAAGSGMLHMIEELLEIARVESGQTVLNLSAAPLAAIATSGIRAAADAHPGAVKRIALVAADDRVVRVDTEHLAKAIASVASSATELTAATVRVEARIEPGTEVSWIVVQCTIREEVDRETLTSLLDPFWQGEAGTGAVKFGATRLGLALAHRYTEIMGGDLTVTTSQGETVFIIRVPDAGNLQATHLS